MVLLCKQYREPYSSSQDWQNLTQCHQWPVQPCGHDFRSIWPDDSALHQGRMCPHVSPFLRQHPCSVDQHYFPDFLRIYPKSDFYLLVKNILLWTSSLYEGRNIEFSLTWCCVNIFIFMLSLFSLLFSKLLCQIICDWTDLKFGLTKFGALIFLLWLSDSGFNMLGWIIKSPVITSFN